MEDPKEFLSDLYNKLGDLEDDFRNYNLTNLIISKVTGKKVLDVGCGNGVLLSKLENRGKEVFGIEPNEDLIKLARQLNPSLNLILGDAASINKIDSCFDTITVIDVLEHIENDTDIIKDIGNKLEKSGQLIVVVPAIKYLYGNRDKSNGHHRRYSKKELVSKLNQNGFKIISIRSWNIMGVLPYFFYEKILNKALNPAFREKGEIKKSILAKLLNKLLNLWFRYFENSISFGLGLSIICVSEKL